MGEHQIRLAETDAADGSQLAGHKEPGRSSSSQLCRGSGPTFWLVKTKIHSGSPGSRWGPGSKTITPVCQNRTRDQSQSPTLTGFTSVCSTNQRAESSAAGGCVCQRQDAAILASFKWCVCVCVLELSAVLSSEWSDEFSTLACWVRTRLHTGHPLTPVCVRVRVKDLVLVLCCHEVVTKDRKKKNNLPFVMKLNGSLDYTHTHADIKLVC